MTVFVRLFFILKFEINNSQEHLQDFVWIYSPVQFIPASDAFVAAVSGSRIDGDGWVQVRERVCLPVPHGFEQFDHGDQWEKPPST